MGSTGTGRFTDYPGSMGTSNQGGGSGQVDRCDKAFTVILEDVEHSEYYQKNSLIPPNGTIVKIERKKRIVAVLESGEILGNLPTNRNYLSECLEDGYEYIGKIRDSSNIGNRIMISADFAVA